MAHPPTPVRAAFVLAAVHACGATLALVSAFVPWTKTRFLAGLATFYLPGGDVMLLLGAVACLLAVVVDVSTRFQHGSTLAVKIAGTTAIAVVFLGITAAYQELVAIQVGYFLAGAGLIACTFEIVVAIILHVNVGPIEGIIASAPTDPATLSAEQSFYEALNHEVRRRMLRMIGEKGGVTFTEFKKAIDIGTGTLYHHLNILSPLVIQGEGKKYKLSKLGEFTLQFMRDNVPYITGMQGEGPGERLARPSLASRVRGVPGHLAAGFARLFQGPRRAPYVLLLPVAMFACSALLGFQSLLFFFSRRFAFGPWGIIISVAGWLLAWGIMEGLASAYFKKKGNRIVSLAGVGACFVPMFLHDVIVAIIEAVAGTGASGLASGGILVGAQLATLLLLVSFQMHHKDVGVQKALSIVLPAHYLSIFVNVLLVVF